MITLEALTFVLGLLESPSVGDAYAKHILKAAELADVDPLYLAAYVDHESHFIPGASSRDGEDIGLGQIRLRYQSACREGLRTDSCKAERVRLLDPGYNLRVLAGKIQGIKKSRIYQENPEPAQWLAGLAGTANPQQKRVKEILKIHQRLADWHRTWEADRRP